jgi:hypothetical protein
MRQLMLDGYFHALEARGQRHAWAGLAELESAATVTEAVAQALRRFGPGSGHRVVFIEAHADAEWTAALEAAHAPSILHEELDRAVSG